jgi:hypothetical protein
MKELKEIRDDQIRIIGEEEQRKPLSSGVWIIAIIVMVIAAIGITISLCTEEEMTVNNPESLSTRLTDSDVPIMHSRIGSVNDSQETGYTEIKDTVINDIPMRIFIPHNAEMSLHVGKIDKEDKDIIYVAQAADVRADNGGIVGAFVLKGEPIARGMSKKGFCASINGEVTIGVAESSPLFEKSTEEEGYFFRQYPLVSNGKAIDNEPKGKSIRRAICDRNGEIFMVETGTPESFHDFSQALVDLGVKEAVYLVGSTAYGWAVDENGEVHEFGQDHYYTGKSKMPKNISYIVWKRK